MGLIIYILLAIFFGVAFFRKTEVNIQNNKKGYWEQVRTGYNSEGFWVFLVVASIFFPITGICYLFYFLTTKFIK